MLKDKLVTLGNTVGKYRIEARIAEGGMGVFWRALDTKLDRIVGLKTLHAEFSVEPSLRDRFINEARALAKLNHPNICVLHDFFESGEQLYIVMEYIQGETLADLVKHKGAFPRSEVIPVFRQILLALDYAHNHGVIHRDIKPSNIMVTEQGMVKVMDFGIAKMVEAPIQLTRTGRKVGSLLFMSPEQIREQPVDQRSDLYSLGVTLYQVCTGRVPFDATSEYDAMKAHLEDTPPSPRSINPEIAEDLEYVIMRALSKRAEDRFQNANEMRTALGTGDMLSTGDRVVIPSGEKTRVDVERPTPPSNPGKKRTGWMIAAGVATLGLVAGIFAFRSGGPTQQPVTAVTPAPTQSAKPAQTLTPTGASNTSAATAGTQRQDTAMAQSATPPVTAPGAQESQQTEAKSVSPTVAPLAAAGSGAQKPLSHSESAPPTTPKSTEARPAGAPPKKSSQATSNTGGSTARETPAPPKAPVVLSKYSIAVEVKPAGTYQIDRSGFGRAAARVDEGKHKLEVMGPGFPIYQQPFVLKRDTSILVDLDAASARTPDGDLRVSAKSSLGEFPVCQVKVNGVEAGALPGLRLDLRAGLYEIELVPPAGLQVDSLQFEGTTLAGGKARIKVPARSRSFARYYLSGKK